MCDVNDYWQNAVNHHLRDTMITSQFTDHTINGNQDLYGRIGTDSPWTNSVCSVIVQSNMCTCTSVLLIIKLTKNPVLLRFHCGSGKLKFRRYSPCFAICMNVVHSLEPDETPNYSASHQAPNYIVCATLLNIAKYSKKFFAVALRLWLYFQFTYIQYCTVKPV